MNNTAQAISNSNEYLYIHLSLDIIPPSLQHTLLLTSTGYPRHPYSQSHFLSLFNRSGPILSKMAPSSRLRSSATPTHRSSSSSLRDSNLSSSIQRAALSNPTFDYGSRDEFAIMSGSSVRHTVSPPSLRSSSHSSRSSLQSETSSSCSASGSRFGSAYEPGYGAQSARTIRDSNVIVHTPTTTIGSCGNIYCNTVVEPAGSSTCAGSSRMSGETLVASSCAPDSIRSYVSSKSSSCRSGDNNRFFMTPHSRHSGASSRDGGFEGISDFSRR